VPAVDGRVTVTDILAATDTRTRVVAISWVMFSNGYRIDLPQLADACRARSILLVVDAIQGVGCLPLDVSECHVDFLATAAHKWLLSPLGVGCFYCRAEHLDSLELTQVGQNSVVPTPNYLDYRFVPKPTAARFEPGVANLGAIA